MDQAAHKPTPRERKASWGLGRKGAVPTLPGRSRDRPWTHQQEPALDCSMVFSPLSSRPGCGCVKSCLERAAIKSQCNQQWECGRWPPQLFSPGSKTQEGNGIPLVVTASPACKGLTISIQLKKTYPARLWHMVPRHRSFKIFFR